MRQPERADRRGRRPGGAERRRCGGHARWRDKHGRRGPRHVRQPARAAGSSSGEAPARCASRALVAAAGVTDGGRIEITGRQIALEDGARVDASGGHDGGSISVGGDLQGAGPLPRARTVEVAGGAALAADGQRGAGGQVIVWADGATTSAGGSAPPARPAANTSRPPAGSAWR